MAENLKDILSNLNAEVDQETLLKYLQGELSAEHQHELEKSLLENPFENDAIDGLQEMPDKANLELLVDVLNKELKKKTSEKTTAKNKLKLRANYIVYFAILLFLLLIILCYFIVTHYLKANG